MTQDSNWMEAYRVVREAFESQGTRHPKAALERLTTHLLDGKAPETYGERVAQMALQRAKLI